MLIFPAIDLYEGKAVRLYQGDYARMIPRRWERLFSAAAPITSIWWIWKGPGPA